MKRLKPIFFIIHFLIGGGLVFGQNIQELEKQYSDLLQQIERQQSSLDSLNALLEQQAKTIDREKQKENADKNRIRQLMAGGLQLSQKIELLQQQLFNLNRNEAALNSQLAQRYFGVLDSLQEVEKSPNYRGDRQALRGQIVTYTEKYLRFSPSFKALSFDPQKIREIDLSETTDSLEREISADYLRRAVSDVNSHLRHIEKNREELENIVKLEEKTQEFLEAVEDEQFGLFAQSVDAAASPAGSNDLSSESFQRDPPGIRSSEQLQAIALFFDQLKIDLTGDVLQNWHSPVDSTEMSISLEDYLQLLKEAEKRLKQYRVVISGKLGQK